MSAYKQAGITLNRALAISAKTLRNALKPDIKASVERRGAAEIRVTKYENGKASEPKLLDN